MPLALLMIGVMLIVAALRGTERELFALIKSDFTGPNNFIFWVLSLYLISALGYIPQLRKLSNTFLVLVVLALFLSNKGFFAKFMGAINGTTKYVPQDTGGTSVGNAIGSLAKGVIPKVLGL